MEGNREINTSFPSLSSMPQEFIMVRIQEPYLHNKKSWRPYITYEIFLHTNSISFTRKTSRVRRRFSEFVWLRHKMMKNASMITVPPLPPKDPFFNCWCEDDIEVRRKGLQTFLNQVVEIAPLLADSLLHLFLQSGLDRKQMEACATGLTDYTVSEAVEYRRGVPDRPDGDSAASASAAILPLKKWQLHEYGDWFVVEELEPFEFPPTRPLEIVREEDEVKAEEIEKEEEVVVDEEEEVEEEEVEEVEESDEAMEDMVTNEDGGCSLAVPIEMKGSTQQDRSVSSSSSGVSVDSVSSSCSPPGLADGDQATRRAALQCRPRGQGGDDGDDNGSEGIDGGHGDEVDDGHGVDGGIGDSVNEGIVDSSIGDGVNDGIGDTVDGGTSNGGIGDIVNEGIGVDGGNGDVGGDRGNSDGGAGDTDAASEPTATAPENLDDGEQAGVNGGSVCASAASLP